MASTPFTTSVPPMTVTMDEKDHHCPLSPSFLLLEVIILKKISYQDQTDVESSLTGKKKFQKTIMIDEVRVQMPYFERKIRLMKLVSEYVFPFFHA